MQENTPGAAVILCSFGRGARFGGTPVGKLLSARDAGGVMALVEAVVAPFRAVYAYDDTSAWDCHKVVAWANTPVQEKKPRPTGKPSWADEMEGDEWASV